MKTRGAGSVVCGLSLTLVLGVVGAPQVRAQAAFTEEAVARGIDYETGASAFGFGLALADLDGDGDPDVVVLGKPNGVVGLYENDGSGHFIERSNEILPLEQTSGVVAGDYDGDGDLDLFISRWYASNVLLENEGGFRFTDRSEESGLDHASPGSGCAWADFDGDGWIDLYVGNRTPPQSPLAYPNQLYRNLGDGTFEEVLADVGMTGDGMTFQAVFFDYDQDGDPDLYISNDKCTVESGYNNRLWENVGGMFVDVTELSGTGACIDSMGVAVGDFDGNGRHDLYPTNTAEGNPLFLNRNLSSFTEAASAAGVGSFAGGWGAIFFDYDNDTGQELFVGNMATPNRLYDDLDGGWPCTDVAGPLGLTDPSGLAFGAASGDIDGDGDLDLMVSNGLGPIRLYVNHEGETRRWVKFDVVGQGHNTFALGTRVEIRAGTARQMREVIAGSSYKSQNELTLHFGMDTALDLDQVEVIWPGGDSRLLSGLVTNRTWTLYPPEKLADGDHDGDVDLHDFNLLVDCLTGDAPGSLEPGCEMMDLEGDADVDAVDSVGFLARYAGPLHDCNANGTLDLQDIVEGSAGDVDRNGVPDGCQALGAPAGRVPNGGDLPGTALTVTRLAGGQISLEWAASCVAGDGDYAIYEGVIGDYASHAPSFCSTDGATERTFTPGSGNRYYLVAPNNGAREGSFGNGSNGSRPAGVWTCLARDSVECE